MSEPKVVRDGNRTYFAWPAHDLTDHHHRVLPTSEQLEWDRQKQSGNPSDPKMRQTPVLRVLRELEG